MSNQVNSMNKGLTVKDLVTTGIFTALLFVFVLVGGVFFATNPVLTFFMPAGGGLLAGPIYLLLIAKVHKRWSLSIMGMAVMLRYIPTIQEDWRYIKDAMRMRDVSPSLASFLAHPGMTVECIYVPLLMAASKAADDLSVASVTRGIENPNPRTCLVQIKCGAADWGVMAVAVAYLIFELCVRGGVIG